MGNANRAASFRLGRWDIPYYAIVAILVAVLGYLLFGKLGDMYIVDYDEARHGISAYEMLRSGDYIINTYQGVPDFWNLKPPLSFWLVALSYRLFGYTNFALRFFSALAAMLSAAAIGLWAARRAGRWALPVVLTIFVANSTLYGLHFARFGDADSQYQLFFTLSMLCMLQSDRSFRWLYGSGLFFGLAFLEKGLHAAVIPVTCFAMLLCTGRLKELSVKRVLLLLLSGVALILPWALMRYLQDGLSFFQGMVSTDVINRVGSTAHDDLAYLSAWQYYLRAITQSPAMLVCLGLIMVCLLTLVIKRKLNRRFVQPLIGCVLWLAIPYVFYSAMNVKYIWYVYSSYMAIPTLTALLLVAAFKESTVKWRIALAVVTCAAAVCLAGYTWQNIQKVNATSSQQTVQNFMADYLDKEYDQGKHVYIQYNEENRTEWMPADMLKAYMLGDVLCLDGGAEAFMADEEDAILLIAREQNQQEIDTLMEAYAWDGESYYMMMFTN